MKNSNFLDKFRLDNKTAVITGGLGILGKNFCRGLAEAGANIAIIDLITDDANGFAKSIETDYSVKCAFYPCDVSIPEQVQTTIDQIAADFGEINILLNNAGGKSSDIKACFAPFEDYSFKIWREIMSVNIDGVFLVAQAVGKQMIKQKKGGSIIQTGSIYGLVAPDQRIYEGSNYLGTQINSPAVYTASKAAVLGLTKYLACYWAKDNIRVNSICPGGVESGQNDIFVKNYSNRIPMERMAKAEEMVGAVLYLASDNSAYTTGENITVDGGLSAW